MKKRQRRIAALLLACAVASVPVSQAFAETTYDVAAGVDAQILFPKDCLTNIAGAVTVDGAEAAADENGSWTNADDAKVYCATLSEDGTLQITAVGYVLDVEHGTSKSADENAETSGRHYQFGDWEKPETPVDRAYYAQGDTVKLKADDPADGMEFKEWKCDTEGVTIADPTSPETTFTMPDKKVKITAEYQEKQEAVTEAQTEVQTETAAQTEMQTEAQTETAAQTEVQTEAQTETAAQTEQTEAQTVPTGDQTETPDILVTPETHIVTVNDGQVSGDFTAGSTMTVTANDRTAEGYQFGGWYVDSMNASLDDAAAMEAHFTMPDADVTLTATYNAIQTDAPETQTETAVQTEAQTEAAIQTEAQTETATQTEAQTEAATQTEAQTEAAIQTEAQTETAAQEVQTEAQVATPETQAVEKYSVTVTNEGIGNGE